ncbi:MAG: CD225/dispanin family protein [Weeksellaceae bacterium]
MENHNIQANTPPENNLIWAILSTVFCCLPTGIYAIIKASEVNSKWNAGDYVGAQQAADDAKKWSIYGAVAGFIVGIIYFVLTLFTSIGEALLSF